MDFKIVKMGESWHKFRDDELRSYERFFLGKGLETLKYVMQVSFDRKTGKRSEWLGYYTKGGQQYGLSFHPREDYPELAKYYKQVKK